MIREKRLLSIMFLLVFSVSCGGGGGGGVVDGGGGGGDAPFISDLSFDPTSAIEGSGGGTTLVSGTLYFEDSDGNVSTLTTSVFDSDGNQIDSTTDPIDGVSGVTTGYIEGAYYVDTSVVGKYTIEIFLTDTTNLSSNILSGDFEIIHDDTKDLDSTFGNDGIVLYEGTAQWVNDVNDEGRAIELQTDGKILIAGYSFDDALILRYNSDGSLDDTFGTNGVVIFDGKYDQAFAICLQSDTKIVVVGYSDKNGEGDNVLVLRYNSDGTLDTTFGANGIILTKVGDYDYGYSVVIQPDGKIVVAGSTLKGSDTYALVLRYNSDGSLDDTFGTNGVVKYDGIGSDIAYKAALQSDGKIIITGSSTAANYPNTAYNDVLILRYNSDGTLDSTFGKNGVVTYDNFYEDGRDIKIQPDGKIVIVGGISGDINAVLVLRYTDAGTLDNTFGTNGVVIYNPYKATEIYGNSLVLQPDGKIVAVGYYVNKILVARYNSDGTLDTSFSGDGFGLYSSGNGFGYGQKVALQSDGKIIVTGSSSFHDNSSDYAVITIRLVKQ